jgi:glycosyltransferase involved in cell wall biosynthesis
MGTSPFFSIITASFNSGKTICITLQSICRQSFSDLEHIVIDGLSKDNTIDVLKSYASRYPLDWVSEPDHGIADALNKGIRRAKGRYLLVLQADDYFLNETSLECVRRLIQKTQYDIFSFPVERERPDGSIFLYRPIRIPGWFHFKHTIPHQGAFVHRRVFDRIGEFRSVFSIAMDYDFFYRAFKAGVRIRYASMPIARMGGGGISSGNRFLIERLGEERRVQQANERNPGWRIAQAFFRRVYVPYKILRAR